MLIKSGNMAVVVLEEVDAMSINRPRIRFGFLLNGRLTPGKVLEESAFCRRWGRLHFLNDHFVVLTAFLTLL